MSGCQRCTLNTPNNVLGVQNNNSSNSLNDVLNCLIGRRCICEFQAGNSEDTKTGILSEVGSDYLALKSANCDKTIYCNTCNLKFVTIAS